MRSHLKILHIQENLVQNEIRKIGILQMTWQAEKVKGRDFGKNIYNP